MEHVFAIAIIILLVTPLVISTWRDRKPSWHKQGLINILFVIIGFQIIGEFTDNHIYRFLFGILLAASFSALFEKILNSIRGNKTEGSTNVD